MFKFSVTDPHFLPHCGCEFLLQAEKGDFITLVGENGVGKSSLAERFYQQSPGEISYLQQQPLDIFYDRSLGRIREIFLSLKDSDISAEIFNHLWEVFLLSQKENRLQSELSGGEGQALKLCLGLSVNRPLYILDEPSQFLDLNARKILSNVLREFISESKTIIMIEHDLNWINVPMKVMELSISNQVLKEKSSWTI